MNSGEYRETGSVEVDSLRFSPNMMEIVVLVLTKSVG